MGNTSGLHNVLVDFLAAIFWPQRSEADMDSAICMACLVLFKTIGLKPGEIFHTIWGGVRRQKAGELLPDG